MPGNKKRTGPIKSKKQAIYLAINKPQVFKNKRDEYGIKRDLDIGSAEDWSDDDVDRMNTRYKKHKKKKSKSFCVIMDILKGYQ